MLKISFIVFILILLPGCGAKGELFLAKPGSEQPIESVETEPKADSTESVPKRDSDNNVPNNPILGLELPTK